MPKEKNSGESKERRAENRGDKYRVFLPIILISFLFLFSVYLLLCPGCGGGREPVVPGLQNTTNTTENQTGIRNITIYEFSDFKCPYCAAADGYGSLINRFKSEMPSWEPPLKKIREEYGDSIRIEYKHFIVHPSAQKAAEAAECARDQGSFWEMYDIMFKNQQHLKVADLESYALQIGLNTTLFNSCLESGEKKAVVDADIELGKKLGVTGTPTFFIGGLEGWKIVGAQPYSKFEGKIDLAFQGVRPPKPVAPIASFSGLEYDKGICTEDGKPIIRLFTASWCPHCNWVGGAFDSVVREYMEQGKIVAYHWEADTGDNTLTPERENSVPASERAIFKEFNPRGSVPTFVFGCKYYRIGTMYERQNDLESEKRDFRAVIDALVNQTSSG